MCDKLLRSVIKKKMSDNHLLYSCSVKRYSLVMRYNNLTDNFFFTPFLKKKNPYSIPGKKKKEVNDMIDIL